MTGLNNQNTPKKSPFMIKKRAKWQFDGTSIPQIQLRASQLEKEKEGEGVYKRRKSATGWGFQKIKERKFKQEEEREREIRELFTSFFHSYVPLKHCFLIYKSLIQPFFAFNFLLKPPIVVFSPIFLEINCGFFSNFFRN